MIPFTPSWRRSRLNGSHRGSSLRRCMPSMWWWAQLQVRPSRGGGRRAPGRAGSRARLRRDRGRPGPPARACGALSGWRGVAVSSTQIRALVAGETWRRPRSPWIVLTVCPGWSSEGTSVVASSATRRRTSTLTRRWQSLPTVCTRHGCGSRGRRPVARGSRVDRDQPHVRWRGAARGGVRNRCSQGL